MPIKHCSFKPFFQNENPHQAKLGAGSEVADCSYPG